MSNDDVSASRRSFLTFALAAVPAAGLLGAGTMVPAARALAAGGKPYEPHYFTPDEWAFVKAATDRLIPPSEDGPGALEAGVPEFIDRQMDDAYGHGGYWYMHGPFVPDAPATLGYQLRFTPRELYRSGIAALDRWCRSHGGKPFHERDADARDAILARMEDGSLALDGVPAKAFFTQLLDNAKEGYFADPMYGGNRGMGSWKMIGFPGARADFEDWLDRPGAVYPLGPVSIKEA